MSKPKLLDAYTPESLTIGAVNANYAEIGEWADSNPDSEDRIGYFVSVDNTTPGMTIVKATSTSDVRGVTMSSPGFSANASIDKYDESGNLLPRYDYVGFAGVIPVIDNGKCTINDRCMPDDNGTAIPSSNNLGYQVIDRIDDTHILILVEPQGDMIQRIKTVIENIISGIEKVGNANNSDKIDGYHASELPYLPLTGGTLSDWLKFVSNRGVYHAVASSADTNENIEAFTFMNEAGEYVINISNVTQGKQANGLWFTKDGSAIRAWNVNSQSWNNMLTDANVGSYALAKTGGSVGPFLITKQDNASEGGQLDLEKPVNSDLAGNVAIDIVGNAFRVFEYGDTCRGVYVDLTTCASGSSSMLIHSGNISSYAIPKIEVSGTLSAGSTSITLSNSNITTNSTINVYTNVFGVSPTDMTVETGKVTLTFKAQSSDIAVKIRIS